MIDTRTQEVWEALKTVKDPEIPTVSLVDLGVITGVELGEGNAVRVTMTPTFVGCPAMDYMRNDVRQRLEELGFADITVEITFDEAWSSNSISEEGLAKLKQHGLAPPPRFDTVLDLTVLSDTPCPFCGSRNTTLHSPFGPTLCRSIHYCNDCRQAFEGFKPI